MLLKYFLIFNGLITLLVSVFNQKYQIGHSVFLSFNSVPVFKILIQFDHFH